MTIDVNVREIDDVFLGELDEIMEDTTVQMFFMHPRSAEALSKAKSDAAAYEALFYVAPAAFAGEIDANCVGFRVASAEELAAVAGSGKPLFVDEGDLTPELEAALAAGSAGGIVLNAATSHDTLQNFFLALGPACGETFDAETLASLSMDRIVLQSGFPDHGFEAIHDAVKTVSDALFRPEQSIIARATKHTLELTGFRGR